MEPVPAEVAALEAAHRYVEKLRDDYYGRRDIFVGKNLFVAERELRRALKKERSRAATGGNA